MKPLLTFALSLVMALSVAANPLVLLSGNSTPSVTEVGYTAIGGNAGPNEAGKRFYHREWTAPVTGTLDRIYIYGINTEADVDVKFALYETDGSGIPTTRIGTETVFADVGTWTEQWKEFTVSYAVTAGTKYRIAYQSSSAGTQPSVKLNFSVESGGNYFGYVAFGTAFPNPATYTGGNAHVYSVKARITPAP